jgi:alpha-beta hydrolase superfamily lysophospholipase
MRIPAFLLLALAFLPSNAHAQDPIKLNAADGVTVYGERYSADGDPKATILLFHQAGSNRGEYAPIAPRLAKAGFDAIAIDQRSGGTRFGHTNQTVDALGASANYRDAFADLEAALAYARNTRPGKPVILWGSSYSASLVFMLAARRPEGVAAILAFSPGEYFGGGAPVAKAAAKVTVPIFVTSSPDASEVAQAKAILAAAPAEVKVQFVPDYGRHGSSTLRADTNPKGAEEVWSAVNAFLARVAGRGAG